jgi:hypothetical protein
MVLFSIRFYIRIRKNHETSDTIRIREKKYMFHETISNLTLSLITN